MFKCDAYPSDSKKAKEKERERVNRMTKKEQGRCKKYKQEHDSRKEGKVRVRVKVLPWLARRLFSLFQRVLYARTMGFNSFFEQDIFSRCLDR